MVLLKEMRHVDNQISHNRQAWQRAQHDRLFKLAQVRNTGKTVLAVDIHRVAATDTLTAGATIRQRIIKITLNPHECIKQHLVGLL